ncbi:hypothetical protein F4604DRAFT_1940325 [Suillus subluteus]|nr:hypothetical protein F4604DRAFT_1940325 [Suillus subluteus]
MPGLLISAVGMIPGLCPKRMLVLLLDFELAKSLLDRPRTRICASEPERDKCPSMPTDEGCELADEVPRCPMCSVASTSATLAIRAKRERIAWQRLGIVDDARHANNEIRILDNANGSAQSAAHVRARRSAWPKTRYTPFCESEKDPRTRKQFLNRISEGAGGEHDPHSVTYPSVRSVHRTEWRGMQVSLAKQETKEERTAWTTGVRPNPAHSVNRSTSGRNTHPSPSFQLKHTKISQGGAVVKLCLQSNIKPLVIAPNFIINGGNAPDLKSKSKGKVKSWANA